MLAEATLLVQAEAELDLVVDGDGDGVEDEDEDEDKGRPVSEIMDVGERFHPLRSSPLVLISQRFVFFIRMHDLHWYSDFRHGFFSPF